MGCNFMSPLLGMISMYKFLLCFFLFLPQIAFAVTTNVFFIGGQSNAKSAWADGIEAALVDSNQYENVLVVHQQHSGAWLQFWYSENGAGQNYRDDFFNTNGTAALQTVLNNNETVLSGLFWFQGEGDAGDSRAMDRYATRFTDMIDEITDSTPNLDPNFQYALSLIDADFDPLKRQLGNASVDDIDRMREILKGLAGDLYYDSRGLERTDKFHLTSEALYDAGLGLGETFLSSAATSAVPIPAGFPLLLSALFGLGYFRKSSKATS